MKPLLEIAVILLTLASTAFLEEILLKDLVLVALWNYLLKHLGLPKILM